MWVIRKGRLYVTKTGSLKSYTTSKMRARKFSTAEEAQAAKCDNEFIQKLENQ